MLGFKSKNMELEMNWDAIGAIGEVLGAVVVLVTLVILIVQLRQNTNEVRASTIQSLHEKSIEVFGESMRSELPVILAKNQSDEELTSEERQRYLMFLRRNLQLFELVLMNYQQGRLGQEVMDAYNQRMRSHVNFSYWDELWPTIKPTMTKSFQAHMEEL
jgi:hypothetical protein